MILSVNACKASVEMTMLITAYLIMVVILAFIWIKLQAIAMHAIIHVLYA
jgi:hypothetical protein